MIRDKSNKNIIFKLVNAMYRTFSDVM